MDHRRYARPALHRTLTFLEQEFDLAWIRSRRQAVLRWADDTHALRAVAQEFGVAQSDDWYLGSAEPSQSIDWYGELVQTLIEEEGQPHRSPTST